MKTLIQPPDLLLKGLYTIVAQSASDGQLATYLTLDSGHRLYTGHFPGRPITPGVCLIQIVKELLMLHLQTPLRLHYCSQVKFAKTIDPVQVPDIAVTIQYQRLAEGVKTQATVQTGEMLYCKIACQFIRVEVPMALELLPGRLSY